MEFTVYTGTYGILTLPDEHMVQREIYLISGRKMVVPEYIWKIILSELTGEGIAFVTVNNPYMKVLPVPFCRNVCGNSNWALYEFDNITAGHTYCCSVSDFRRVVPYTPPMLVKSVLVFDIV